MITPEKHIILHSQPITEALKVLESLSENAILFVVNDSEELVGAVTDGDIRRGLLKGLTVSDPVLLFSNHHPKFVYKDKYNIKDIVSYRQQKINHIPVVDPQKRVVAIINLLAKKSYLPIDVVIIAGGRGERLKPLTDSIPKPMLKVGDKYIVEYNFDSLVNYGVQNFWFCVRYLGQQIVDYFGDGKNKGVNVDYIWENEPLGTIGALSKIDTFKNEYILVTNSDLLVHIDFEDFLIDFIDKGADLSVVSIPYKVTVPYGVLETNGHHITDIKEKPTYVYYSNGGMYLLKKSLLQYIPKEKFYNATDLIEALIADKKTVTTYPLMDYWLDIGNKDDFIKAQEEIKHLKF